MSLFDLDRWNEIWDTINRNRKRSILTAFGIFWGIFMLIIMSGIGMGFERTLRTQLKNVAVNACFFFNGETSLPYKGLRSGRSWRFNNEDMEVIKRQVNGVQHISGVIWGATRTFANHNYKGDYQLMGYDPAYQQINHQTIKAGRFINDLDMAQQRKVCVIGKQVAQDLFPGIENPMGQTIRMSGIYLTVVGVTAAENRGVSFSDAPKTVIIPFSTIQKMYNMGTKFQMLSVAGYDNVDITKLDADLKATIRTLHTISPDDTKAVNGFNMGENFRIFNSLFLGISLLTWIVGVGTLLAGIVGVSNIMLVVIRERTQEIGIRRALGAPPRAIITQILSESFVLTFIAGIAGLACAVGLLSLIESILSASGSGNNGDFSLFTSTSQISLPLALGSTAILIAGGLLAGAIPAYRALRVKPVEAIREE